MEKNDICTSVVTLRELFKESERYIIPGYQRPYEWSEKQLDSMLESVTTIYNEGNGKVLVFGTLQFNVVNEGNVEKYEIIDGQQRMTSFYLLLVFIKESLCEKDASIVFELDNKISNNYNEQFKNFRNDNISSKYRDNYILLSKKLTDVCKDKEKCSGLLNFILDNILFVRVVTKNNNSINDTLRIFDALNTTGLPLDVKDIFKISFYNYLNNKKNKSVEFSAINKAYEHVNMNELADGYHIKPDDLIDAYRYMLLVKFNNNIKANSISQSSNDFFEWYFNNDNNNDAEIEWDLFINLANNIKEYQNALSIYDNSEYKNIEDIRLACAKEILHWSGYYRIRNVVFVIYSILKEKNVASPLKETLKVTELLWLTCGMLRSVTSKVLTCVFDMVGKLLTHLKTGVYNYEELQKQFKEWIGAFNYFGNVYNVNDGRNYFIDNVIKGDVLDNISWFYVLLSYIDDYSDEKNIKPIDIKNTMFFCDKFKLEVEHIVSSTFCSDVEWCNHIGNLMYLEGNINSALGNYTKKNNNNMLKDFKHKIDKNTSLLNYENSTLKSISRFQKDYVPNEESIMEFDDNSLTNLIIERDTSKQNMLIDLFNKVMPDIAQVNNNTPLN